jgi:hypothetical protein
MFAHPSHVMTLLRRPVAVWLALCLALLGALAPTVSHALNGARGGNAGLIEVCTSNGPRWMALPGTTESTGNPQLGRTQASDSTGAVTLRPDDPLSPAVFEHCPFCLLLLDRAAPPPQAWQMPLALAQASAAPMPLQVQYLPVFYAHTPPPRGPPISF